MPKYLAIFVLLCVTLPNFMNSSEDFLKPLHGGRTKAIINKIQEQARATALTIKQLKIISSRDQVELTIMLNEFAYKMQLAIYNINQALPIMKNKEYKENLEELVLTVVNLVHEVQSVLHEDPVQQQEKIVSVLEKFVNIYDKVRDVFAEYHKEGETFTNHQIRRVSDIVIWALYKLHNQAKYFTKTTTELDKEIDTGIASFQTTFAKINLDDEETKDELVHLVQHLEELTQAAVVKLEHWLNLNNADEASSHVIEGTAKTLSAACGKLHDLSVSNQGAIAIATQFREAYNLGAKDVKHMINVADQNTVGGQEFLRSVVLDCITVGNTFSMELEIFLSKKDIHVFV